MRKKMKKKIVSMLLVAAMVASMAVGCGSKNDSGSSDTKSDKGESITFMAPDWAIPSDDQLDEFTKDYAPVSTPETADAILVRSAAMHEMEFATDLKAIARAGAGVNNIPLEKCAEQGIVVFNTPGANANGVKELVIAGMLLASRDIIGGINWGLVGLFQFDFVGWLLGGSSSIWSRIVFTVVGVAAVCGIPGLFAEETEE